MQRLFAFEKSPARGTQSLVSFYYKKIGSPDRFGFCALNVLEFFLQNKISDETDFSGLYIMLL
jgi:hypothetical protein